MVCTVGMVSADTTDTDQPGVSDTEHGRSTDAEPSVRDDRSQTDILIVAVIAAVIVGSGVLAVLFGTGLVGGDDGADGSVAVVSIEGPIAGSIGEQLETELRNIRANDSIDAVVLKMDTPGGSPAPTERMYMSIQRTSKEMPVHASVQGLSASAGYYMMLPAEEIYVLPTSQVGSVGLAASEPRAAPPVEGPSGPNKRGANVIESWESQETIANIFIETVVEQRGDQIELDREGISTAKVFTGVNAVENGFADQIGSVDVAVADAAEKAGLEEYNIVEREVSLSGGLPFFAQSEHGVVAIYDENPSMADVKPLDYAMVYEPAIPRLEELETVSTGEADQMTANFNTTTQGGAQS